MFNLLVVVVALYVLLDVALTSLAFGFYTHSWEFNTDAFLRTITFSDAYHFTTSAYEFLLMLFVRQCFSVVALLLIVLDKRDKLQRLSTPVTCNAVFTFMSSLVKFLAFSNISEQLYYPGVWVSVGWSILSGFVQVLVWRYVFSTNSFYYRRLINDTGSSEESSEEHTETATTEGDLESGTSPAQPREPFKDILFRLFSYCGHEWRWFVAGAIFLTINSIARIYTPKYTAQVIADIVNERGSDALVHSILVLIGLTAVSAIFNSLRGGCFDYAAALIALRIRLDLFSSLVYQDISFYDTSKTGDIMSRLTSDCQEISRTLNYNVNMFMRNGVMLVGMFFFMMGLCWRLTMVTLIMMPVLSFITKLFGAYYASIAEKRQKTISEANEMAQEVLSSVRTVRSFAGEKMELSRFNDLLHSTLSVNRKTASAYMVSLFLSELHENLIFTVVISYGGYLVSTDKIAKEELVSFLLYQIQFTTILRGLTDVASGIMEAVGASRKVFGMISRQPQFKLDGVQRPPITGNIEFTNVGFTYPSRPNNPVLTDLSLLMKAGETVALVGPSGGGKSSIVSLIEHFYEPTTGDITMDGIPIKEIDHVHYHQKVALVAQEPILYNGSVRHNILYGCDFATEDDMLKAAKMANVHDFVTELDEGYDTNCGEKGAQMSGGQKQRIAIARALVRNPAVLILDEATSALDTESEALVQQALSRCAQERTVIIIAHRMSTIEKADKIAVIVKGHLVQMGTHSDLMKETGGMYYSLVSRQLLNAKVGEEE